MQQVLFTGTGQVEVCEVPAPQVLPGSVLVRTMFSLISSGTEAAALSDGGALSSIVDKVRNKPERIEQVWKLVQQQGFANALATVQQKLQEYGAPGYSLAGIVVDAAADAHGFNPGDLVACMGAGFAVHAEFVVVPINLAVKIPGNVRPRDASYAALLCIAMQGIRRLQLDPGAIVAVIGLGLLGQLTLQLAKAMGYRPVGFDIDASRAKFAEDKWGVGAWSMTGSDPKQICNALSEGYGVDGVIITAATPSNDPLDLACDLCRRGGRVSIVGDVGLNLSRDKIYRKETEIRISCSYGPGRYDEDYEVRGHDYPYTHVRWTERRNLQHALHLLGEKQIDVEQLTTGMFRIDRAVDAYQTIKARSGNNFGVVFDYGVTEQSPVQNLSLQRHVTVCVPRRKDDQIRLGVIGTGSFCRSVHLPNLAALRQHFSIAALVSRTGVSAMVPARKYGVPTVATDYSTVIADPSIDAVLIATRHADHARIVMDALDAGKHVFIEKPMCLTVSDGEAIVRKVAETGLVLQVGFNRRFAPMLRALKDCLGSTGPRIFNCRVNVGPLGDTWSNNMSEGGRLLGEGVHFFDLCNWIMNAEPTKVTGAVVGIDRIENPDTVATLKYHDGSVASVTYTTLGSTKAGKEYYEAIGNGRLVTCDDFVEFHAYGANASLPTGAKRNKGFREQWLAFARAIRGMDEACDLPDARAGLSATRIALELAVRL